MSCASAAPVLLFILIVLLLGLMGWGLLRIWWRTNPEDLWDMRDDVLLGLLALGVFALGAFMTFILVGLH